MGDAGEPEEDTPEERVWIAAAAARSWTAAAHHAAVWESCRNAWTAMADASKAGRSSAEAGGEAVGEGGEMNGTALGNGVDALKDMVEALNRAGAAFSDAAGHARHSAAEWEQAASLHARVGDEDNAAVLRGQADTLHEAGQSAAQWAAKAARDAGVSKKALHKWMACADRWANGGVWPGDRSEWIDSQARIRADSEHYGAKWTEKAEQADATARTVADHMQKYAELAGKMAAASGMPDDVPPGAEKAAKAWKEAMDSARRAAEEYQPRE